jgi:hypothetical protein
MYTKVTRVTVKTSSSDDETFPEIVLPEPEPWEHNGVIYRPKLSTTHILWDEIIAVWEIGYAIQPTTQTPLSARTFETECAFCSKPHEPDSLFCKRHAGGQPLADD